jgi:hypothetical protein
LAEARRVAELSQLLERGHQRFLGKVLGGIRVVDQPEAQTDKPRAGAGGKLVESASVTGSGPGDEIGLNVHRCRRPPSV